MSNLDESSLRTYFRRVLGVAPGASRKALKTCRDKRCQRWRADLVAPHLDAFPQPTEGEAAANTTQGRLAITNIAFDCLSNADKFREFQTKLNAGEVYLPDLDGLLLALGESNTKPVAPRVLEKRQAKLQEKIDRITSLITDKVKQAGHDEALKLNQGKVPDADDFYDAVYKAGWEAGDKLLREELALLDKAKLEVDQDAKDELSAKVVDQSEIIAHKESDRLEDRVARSAPTPSMPRMVALTLSLMILALVIGTCFYYTTLPPVAGGQYPVPAAPQPTNAVPGPQLAPDATATAPMPAAPAPGIANSVFNRSTFGPPNDSSATAPAAQVPVAPAPNTVGAASTNAIPAAAPPAPPVIDPEMAAAEDPTPGTIKFKTPPDPAISKMMLSYAGASGLAGPVLHANSPGADLYTSGQDLTTRTRYGEAARDFLASFNLSHAKETIYNEGVEMALMGKWAEAIPVYSQSLEYAPHLVQAIYNRGSAHQWVAHFAGINKNKTEWQNHLVMAIKNYNLALKYDPHLAQALYNRALAYYYMGDLDQAADDFSKAYETNRPLMSAALYNKQLVELAQKKRSTPPEGTAPWPPIGPVGPQGPP